MGQVLISNYEITFTLFINQFLILNTFAFLFLHIFFISSISLSFDLFEPCSHSLECSVTFCLVSEFLFLYFFEFCVCVATVIKARFVRVITRTLALEFMLVTVYKVKFTLYKTLIAFPCSLLYARLLPSLLFSLKHMACHFLIHEI